MPTDHTGSLAEESHTGAIRSKLYPEGAKFPARYDLMMRNAAGMRRLAETWGEGFAKYGADNWLKGFPASVLISHILEHIRLYLAGDRSEDHPAHGAWNLLTLCWIEENRPDLVDITFPPQSITGEEIETRTHDYCKGLEEAFGYMQSTDPEIKTAAGQWHRDILAAMVAGVPCPEMPNELIPF